MSDERSLNADEARRLTQEALNGPAIEAPLEQVHARIREAAKEGKFSVTHPFHEMKEWPTPTQKEAVFVRLTLEGFTITHHPDPDPGDPRGGAYDEISW